MEYMPQKTHKHIERSLLNEFPRILCHFMFEFLFMRNQKTTKNEEKLICENELEDASSLHIFIGKMVLYL